MSANNAFHIAVLSGDGIGPEVMAPALEVLRKIEATSDLKFRFTEAPAGANNYAATGKSMPESTAIWNALLADMEFPRCNRTNCETRHARA